MQSSVLVGEKVALVPFTQSMVQKYAEWMSDPVLCELTSSEIMSKAEVQEVQKSYLGSKEKWIFIILDKGLNEEVKHEYGEMGRMAGDIDLFKGQQDDEEKECALEINFMIAEKESRRKGLAQEAIRMVGGWAKEELKASKLTAKVLEENQASQHLLLKMGFQECGTNEKFKEIHYVKQL